MMDPLLGPRSILTWKKLARWVPLNRGRLPAANLPVLHGTSAGMVPCSGHSPVPDIASFEKIAPEF
jgi:hypothetical protein